MKVRIIQLENRSAATVEIEFPNGFASVATSPRVDGTERLKFQMPASMIRHLSDAALAAIVLEREGKWNGGAIVVQRGELDLP